MEAEIRKLDKLDWDGGHVANNKQPDRMKTSGIDVVLTQSLLAIVGAIALQKGGEAANHVAREKILKPLGIL